MARTRHGLPAIYNSTPLTLSNEEGAAVGLSVRGFTVVEGNIADDAADPGNPIKVGGQYVAAGVTLDDGDRGDLQLDSTGNLKVTGSFSLTGDTSDLDSGARSDSHTVIGIAVPAAGGHATITGDATNGLDVDVTRLPSNTVAGSASIPAGTNNIGDVDILTIAAGDNNIGNVDVLTVPADPFGANADAAATAGGEGSVQAKLRLVTTQLDAIKTAVETLDNVVGGTEAQVDIVGALPAGTNAIGKLAANSGVDIGDVDILSIAAGDNNIGNVDIASAIPAGTNLIGIASAAHNTTTVYDGTTALTPKFAFANVAASQTDAALVTAVASKKLRVLSWIAVAAATATKYLLNKAGEAGGRGGGGGSRQEGGCALE